eukprot:TRINITY_DN1381_c0_g1_i1.p1 TRINITY_DN1381_c0_g1~~TRINITY_DN1381_c0_g1_i1.p1  ORF type:complete len:150 (-),score=37.34 TRINITY_DN1381_c0_g1_i1:63-479(-)
MLYAVMKRVFRRDPNATTAINHADPKSGYWPLSVASKVVMMGLDCIFEYVKERPTMNQLIQQLESIVATEFANPIDAATSYNDSEMCCVCMAQRAGECEFEPCKHAVTCLDCALEVHSKSGTNRCPLCKRKIDDINEL